MKPRLLFVGHLPPPLHGVSLANQRLLDAGPIHDAFEVRVLPVQGAQSIKEIANPSRLPIGATRRGIKLLAKLTAAVGKADLVYYTPGLFGLSVLRDAVLMKVCEARGVPYCLHLHSGGIGLNWEGRPDGALIQKAHRHMLNQAAMILLLHEQFYPEFNSYLQPETPWCAVGNGVPGSTLQPPIEESGPFRLAFIGNIQPIKGFMYGLQVLAGLPHAELDVVGGFSSEAYQHEIHDQIARLGLTKRVHFHGSQPPETAWDPLEACQVLLFPSHVREGLPLVWLEAMARGKAVVSFDVGCAKTVLGDIATESVVPRTDVTQMIETLKAWDENRSYLASLRLRAQEKAHREFSVTAWQSRVTKALLKALNERNRLSRET
ncbi:MAG TPA: hypothetical protein DEB46_04140 [Myxococcales bacterium]|nr:hypothetical protein [Myxococcales bacterium]